jgi:hypothetical protein
MKLLMMKLEPQPELDLNVQLKKELKPYDNI